MPSRTTALEDAGREKRPGDSKKSRLPAGPEVSPRPAAVQPGRADPRAVLALQRSAGNQAVVRLLAGRGGTVQREQEPIINQPRPGQPYTEEKEPDTVSFPMKEDAGPGHLNTVPRTKHHIIPWNTLRDFLLKASAAGHMDAVGGILRTAVSTMMAKSPRYKEGVKDPLPAGESGGIRKQGVTTEAEALGEIDSTEEKRNGSSVNALTTAYCWMPGNLFVGPLNTFRIDDPDEAFEEGADDPVGSKLADFRRTYRGMREYIGQARPDRRLADRIGAFLRRVARQSEPFPFAAGHWSSLRDETGAYRYYLNRNAGSAKVTTERARIDRVKWETDLPERSRRMPGGKRDAAFAAYQERRRELQAHKKHAKQRRARRK